MSNICFRLCSILNIKVDFPDAVGPDVIAVHGDVNGKEVIELGYILLPLILIN